MTEQHPITPPLVLVKQWTTEGRCQDYCDTIEYVAARAGQWCADQELEACCEWLEQGTLCYHQDLIPCLRAARRPKPPSLKEQALEALDEAVKMSEYNPPEGVCTDQAELIRCALDALPDD
jgi:hypothetical protein